MCAGGTGAGLGRRASCQEVDVRRRLRPGGGCQETSQGDRPTHPAEMTGDVSGLIPGRCGLGLPGDRSPRRWETAGADGGMGQASTDERQAHSGQNRGFVSLLRCLLTIFHNAPFTSSPSTVALGGEWWRSGALPVHFAEHGLF